MGKISTKELFDEFYEQYPEMEGYSRCLVDREEVYDFEKQIGKELVDMNADELLEMIRTYRLKNKKDTNHVLASRSYVNIAGAFRKVFNYYSMEYGPIHNPFVIDPKLKTTKALELLNDESKGYSREYMESIIEKIYDVYGDRSDRAVYLECTIMMYYNGFYSCEEIVTLKRENIDFSRKTVALSGRKINLSDRCFNLMVQVHNMDRMEQQRPVAMLSYKDGYFKFPVQRSKVKDFNDIPLEKVTNHLAGYMFRYVAKPFGVNVTPTNLYYLGFYDFIVDRVGTEHAKELVLAVRNKELTAELLDLANEYGAPSKYNVSKLKNTLRIYLPGTVCETED